MNKSGNQSKTIKTKNYSNNTNNKYTIQTSHIQPDKEDFNELDIDSDFYDDFNPSSSYKNKSIERANKEQGNKVKNIKYELNSRKINTSKFSNQTKNEKKSSKYSIIKNEVERQKALYKSPDIKSGSLFDSPIFMKDNNNEKDFEEIGYKSNYVYESKKINGKNVGAYSKNEKYEYINKNGKKETKYEKSSMGSPSGIEMISPVRYIENNSSGSEMEDNQIKSIENYQYSVKTTNTNKTNYKNNNKLKKIEKNKLNYELEEPEGFDYLSKNKRKISNNELKGSSHFANRSQIKKTEDSYTYTSEIKDFQSPERNPPQPRKFRNINMKMIESKGPTNDDEKVNNILIKEIIDKRNYKDEKQYETGTLVKKKKKKSYYNNNIQIRINAAKIIQAWWRRKNYREEEVYDITVKSAVKLQSFIRGFLVRKKVLRYITLAIYYQSFCDKLQDVLCNYIKKIIFKLFKELSIQKARKINKKNEYKRKQLLIHIVEKTIEKEFYYVLKILKKWKEITYKLKMKNREKEMHKYRIKKTKTDNNFNKSINKTSNTNYTSSQNMYMKEVKVSTVKKSQQQKSYINSYQTKTNKLAQSTILEHNKKDKYFSPRTSEANVSQKVKSPYKYSNIKTELKKKKVYSPYPRDISYEQKYKIETNQSYRTKSKKELEKIQYTKVDNRSNHQSFTRVDKSKEKNRNISTVDKSKEKDRNISPHFATLKKIDNTKTNIKQNSNNKSLKIIDKKRTLSNVNKNIINKIYTKIDTSKASSKSTAKTIEIKKRRHISDINLNKSYKNIIKSKPSTKVSNIRSTTSSSSKKKYSEESHKRSFSTRKYKTSTEYHGYDNNTIDNQLSVSIVKLSNDNDKLNKSTEEGIQKIIRLKEKIIYEKEKPAEMAEESVGFQIFDMKISKRISLYIDPSTELRQKIIDEQKELEVIKKRERERSKEIDKYKKDIELQKLKNLLDVLRRAIRSSESFKRRILQKKFYQFRNNCSDKPLVLEIDPMDDWEITHKPKEKEDLMVQANPPQEKKIRNFKVLKVARMYSISFYSKKMKENNYYNNLEGEGWEYQILKNKPKMVEESAQHEYEENYIQANSFELLRFKPKCKDTFSQYEKDKPKISGQKKFSIINKSKEKLETKEAECNTMIETAEEGINAVEKIKPKIKNVEVQIRTVKRSLVKMEIPILKKLWLRKAFRTFRDNCLRPPFYLILERELLRMAFLRWRFVKGYGPDRYGNCYDRDGNLLYRIKGKVADFETQNEDIIEQDEIGTQYTQVENVISTRKQIHFSPSYEKEIKKETKDQSVGNNIKMVEKIQNKESFNINQNKKKEPNKITNRNNFFILKNQKKVKDKETQIIKVNEIDKMDDFEVIDDEGFLKKKKSIRIKELLTQIFYRREITDKLSLSDALRNWLKQAILLMHNEEIEYENYKRRQTKINKSDRFTLIDNKIKQEAFTQMPVAKNKIQTTSNINLVKNINKKNAQIGVNMPSKFDEEKIIPKKEKKIVYESTKKPLILKANKETNMNIYGQDYIFKEEIRRGIHHQMTDEALKRAKEILYKFIITKLDVFSLLRKYFTIWNRKSNYLSLLDNANIITEFCRINMKKLLTYRKWRKISEKLILKEKIKIVKLSKEITYRIHKIFDLIRITRVNTVYSKQKYLLLIIIAWLAYTKNINYKRNNVKNLYENMMTTYMNVADDVFGKDQKENPSVQDALFEAVDSNKFYTNKLQDVPLAKEYYGKKTKITKITKNISKYSSYGINENLDMDKNEENKNINNTMVYTSYNLKNKPVSTSNSFNTNTYSNIKRKNINEGNRYNIINKYKTKKYKSNKENEREFKSYKIINDDNFNSKGRETTYKIEYTREDRSESKGRESSKEKERSESKGSKSKYINRKEEKEREESKDKDIYKSGRKEKERILNRGNNISTYISKREEDSKGNNSIYKIEKNTIIERKYKNRFDKERVESKKKNRKEDSFESKEGKSLTIEKEERSESKRRGTPYRIKKSERSESKGKGYMYMAEEDFDPNADYNNHKYYESKKYVTKKGNNGVIETKNVTTIKTVNIGEEEKKDKSEDSINEISVNNYDKMDKIERRKLSYGERRKLFRLKFNQYIKSQGK